MNQLECVTGTSDFIFVATSKLSATSRKRLATSFGWRFLTVCPWTDVHTSAANRWRSWNIRYSRVDSWLTQLYELGGEIDRFRFGVS